MNALFAFVVSVRAQRSSVCVLLLAALVACGEAPSEPVQPSARPALTVSLVAPQRIDWATTLTANGNVVAWQEAVIGAELANVRIVELRAQVGDSVRNGQLLARLDAATASSELAEAQAAVAELSAATSEAQANAQRAKELQAQGFYSKQMNTQYQTAEQSTGARLAAARARLQSAQLRLDRTQVLAPDDGVISARTATVGSLTAGGEELFRLIRGGRLEWRAEVPSADLGRLQPGATARLTAPAGGMVEGKVRSVAPSVDPASRNGLVYVDLPASTAAGAVRAGMFARGEFELGRSPALAVPQSAVVLREGFAYVYQLVSGDRVSQHKVSIGRRVGDMVEIVDGLVADARIVGSGAGFLADGDLVRVVAGETAVDAAK